MAGGMGDERKPLSAGDRWQPTASDINALHRAAGHVENLNCGGGVVVSSHRVPAPRLVVSVANQSATDWDIWQPVGVLVPPEVASENLVSYSGKPYFDGYVLDDPAMYSTTLPTFMLGVTQEPIPAGSMGRVCVRGLTNALIWDIEKGQLVAQEYPSRDYAMVEKHVDGRWAFRWAPDGDGKVVGFIRGVAGQPPTYYQDGTYNDCLMVLIDLQSDYVARFLAPNQFWPEYSLVPGSAYWLYGVPDPSSDQTAFATRTNLELYGMPGWDVPSSASVHWVPCRRIVPGRLYCLRYDMAEGGLEGDKWWPGFSGLEASTSQHFLQGDPRRYDQPWFYWYRYTGAARKFNVLVKGDYAYIRGYWNNELDGRTWAGVKYPTVRLPLESLAVPGSRSYNMPWAQDAWGDWVQQATGTVVDNAYFRPDPKYLDEPFGRVASW